MQHTVSPLRCAVSFYRIDMAENDIHEGLTRVISQLTAAVTNTGLYSAAHPQVGLYIDKAYGLLTAMLQRAPEITVLLIGDDLITDNRPLATGASASSVAHFGRILKRKAIERLTFLSGLPKPELQALIQDLVSPDAGFVRSTPFVKLGKVELRVAQDERDIKRRDISEEALQELISLTGKELDELKELYLSIKKHKKIDVRGVDEMVRGFIKGFRHEINPLSLLASIKSADEYTFTHAANVCILTLSQAETVGFQSGQLHDIGVASLLHDVGKIFVPEEILSKPGRLTPAERRIMETHTVKGARYLMGIDGIPKAAVLSALEHHLKYDGTGYPSLKGGWRPNIASQLISIADVFDAMKSNRSYQGSASLEEIAGVLQKGRGSSFNPRLVDHFLKLIRYGGS